MRNFPDNQHGNKNEDDPNPDRSSRLKNSTSLSFIAALQRGDPDAYHRLIDENSDRLYDFLYTVLRNHEDVQDIIQDVFIYIWENRESLCRVRQLDNYIFSIAKYRAFKEKKVKQRFADVNFRELADRTIFSDAADEVMEGKESMAIIERVLEAMPEMRRKVYELSRNKGYSVDRISAQLNISPITVRRHINLALQDIKKAIR